MQIAGVLQPLFGAFATTNGAMMGYGGLGVPFNITDHVFLMPSVAIGSSTVCATVVIMARGSFVFCTSTGMGVGARGSLLASGSGDGPGVAAGGSSGRLRDSARVTPPIAWDARSMMVEWLAAPRSFSILVVMVC